MSIKTSLKHPRAKFYAIGIWLAVSSSLMMLGFADVIREGMSVAVLVVLSLLLLWILTQK